jgi:3'(2'), 5'-bisphosphate nucleotidase
MRSGHTQPNDRADHSRLVPALASLMSEAGARILELSAKGLRGRSKPDASVVTDADEAAEAILRAGIERILPGIPIVAEEAVAHGEAAMASDVFFLVDPLDGTREILAGGSDFTINVALVSARTPVLGLVYAPAEGILYAGSEGRALRARLGPGSRFTESDAVAIRARTRPERLVAVVSRSHLDPATEAFLAGLPVVSRIQVGSAIKFCRLAEGSADVYPRLSPVQEWDAAAGHALLVAAGGSMAAPDGGPVLYGCPEKEWRVDGFVAWGAPA